MTGLELAQRMSAAKLTVDELAASLNRRRDQVSGWLASERNLPKSVASQIDWLLGLRSHALQMQASGLPTCPWVETLPDPPSDDLKALAQYNAQLDTHEKTCPICQERMAFAATLPPLPPFPVRLNQGNLNPWFVWAFCGVLVFFFGGIIWSSNLAGRGRDILAQEVMKVGQYTALAWVALIAIGWLGTRLFGRRGA